MRRLLVVGPVPPPYHGCSVATHLLLHSTLDRSFTIRHLDTTDRRNLDNLGSWDLRNVGLALATVARAIAIAVRERPHVVYIPISQNPAGYLRDGCLILIFAWLGGSSVVVHLHGSSFRRFYDSTNPLLRWFVDLSMRTAARGIVLGENLKPQLQRWLPDKRLAVVPNGTEMTSEASRASGRHAAKYEGAGESTTVLFLGNLLLFKGVADLVAAAVLLLPRHPTLRFRFAGRWTRDPMFRTSGEETRAECLRRIERSGRDGAFEFLGEVDRNQVATLLADADMLVLPSRDEGLPLVLIEAMAAGLPTIASAGVGAIPEVVLHGETGLLVPPGDVTALAHAIETLTVDPALRRRMGAAARVRCERRYSLASWTEGLERVLSGAEARV
jgi:glycosyltransferase involved in cell wall biosynthesis